MLFSSLQEQDLFGGREALADLHRRAIAADGSSLQGVLLAGPRGIGKTEVLKQLYGALFWKQDRVAPFSYVVSGGILSAEDFSRDYLTRFLCQRLSFEDKDQSLAGQEGVSLDRLTALAEARRASWAKELLARFRESAGNPLDALRIALAAPDQSALATGRPVVVMLDEFQRLSRLGSDGPAEPRLISLLEAPLSSTRTVHMITGCTSEILDMDIVGRLARTEVRPLDDDAVSALLLSRTGSAAPAVLLKRLGGNPFYTHCLVNAAAAGPMEEPSGLWTAYLRELTGGTIYLYWSSIMKRSFADPAARRAMLAMVQAVHRSPEPLTGQELIRAAAQEESMDGHALKALHAAGLVRGEFGVFRPSGDEVLADLLECLFQRELLGRGAAEIERSFLDRCAAPERGGITIEMTLPMMRDAELIVARCLEQLGRNVGASDEVIGQFQIAVVEACINALEHGAGRDNRIFIRFDFDGSHLEASIENPGKNVIVPGTGEPFAGARPPGSSGRGWGVKLMKRFADAVSFERTTRGTKVTLMKHHTKSAATQKEVSTNGE